MALPGGLLEVKQGRFPIPVALGAAAFLIKGLCGMFWHAVGKNQTVGSGG